MLCQISSLGSGMDHIMDAITECEQLIRIEGRSEADSPWNVFYRKELFTPWHDASLDPAATDLIYRQIVDGVKREDYLLAPQARRTPFFKPARPLYVQNLL